jgi:hypothetical protein
MWVEDSSGALCADVLEPLLVAPKIIDGLDVVMVELAAP